MPEYGNDACIFNDGRKYFFRNVAKSVERRRERFVEYG